MRMPTHELATGARKGFTLIELLVTLTLIGLLVALLIPAVQQSRESARKMQCQNHLKSFGLALHNFEQAHGHLPGPHNPLRPGDPQTELWSPQAALLPYLDQGNLQRRVIADGITSGVVGLFPPDHGSQQNVPVLQCPSDGLTPGANYVACTGAGVQIADQIEGGVFGGFTPARMGDITDGASQTAAMSEHVKSQPGMAFDRRIHYWLSGANELPGGYSGRDGLIAICNSLTGSPAAYDDKQGRFWDYGSFGRSWCNHALGPNAKETDCSAQSNVMWLSAEGIHPPRSWHAQGVNMLMLDGAVRFTADAIDLNVWRALGTRAGQEVP
jgi:prepilin-type N-terminal cleavage/methylation domain-containing protein/prepilin-type processing-associated H-X9-DG protein